MALVVETGAIVDGANTYVEVADCDSYHADRNHPAWAAATDVQKTAALLAATTEVDSRYRHRFKGQRVKPTIQALEWPRVGVRTVDQPIQYYGVVPSFYDIQYAGFIPINVVPQRVKDAVCSLALRALSGPLSPDLDGAVSKEKVDVIEIEYGKGLKGAVSYPEIDQLLSDYLKPLNSCDAVRG